MDSVQDASSASTSAHPSPFDSPTASSSSTSLSSLASDDAVAKPALDTYGNEFQLPDFTIKQIRDAIPPHCFERSGLRGLGYVARDLACLATVFYLFHNYVTPETIPSVPARAALWALYTFVQGLFATGLWVLAHECGHQSFSTSKTLNDTVGWVLHSALLVPYFSWKISHGKHHKSTGHMERDMVFVPRTRSQYASYVSRLSHQLSEVTEETPIHSVLHLIGQQLAGWPLYLITNVTGHNFHEKQVEGKGKGKKNGWGNGVNHFNPASPLFERKDEHLIILSDIGLGLMCTALYFAVQKFGLANMFVWYFLPYLWVNHWLGKLSRLIPRNRALTVPPVCITFLQHTDPSLPHYQPDAWTYTRGAAATIDREFGFVGRQLFHGIIETHVLHHYVSSIPFYNADEATEAIKPVMGRHYRADTRGGPLGFLRALWVASKWCMWVEPSEGVADEMQGVLFFRNTNGLGPRPLRVEKPVAI
jgi:omega-6 fatty acid desaturase (delta-12 desaturase)